MMHFFTILVILIAFTPVTTPGETLINKRKVSSLMTEDNIGRRPLIVNIGDRFGKLEILKEGSRFKKYQRSFYCKCECGIEKLVKLRDLSRGTQSCGCYVGARTHGLSKLPEYIVWKAMKARCYNPKASNFKHYGGRSTPITICAEWRDSFATFHRDMGPRPTPKHQIERKDNTIGYCKSNCEWTTHTVQVRNTRRNVLNAEMVNQIRELAKAGLSTSAIAKKFAVSWNATRDAIRGKTWRDIV